MKNLGDHYNNHCVYRALSKSCVELYDGRVATRSIQVDEKRGNGDR